MKEELDYSLSDNDIRHIISRLKPNLRYKIVTYDYVSKFETIEQLMRGLDALIILYRTEPTYGHYVCLTVCNTPEYHSYIKKVYNKSSNLPIYCFFDPLGLLVDNELKFVNSKMRDVLKQEFPALRELLKTSPFIVEWNETKVQTNDTSVCGRMAAMRSCLYKMPMKNFIKMIKSKDLDMSLMKPYLK